MLARPLPDGRLLMDREALATLTGRSTAAVWQFIRRQKIKPVERRWDSDRRCHVMLYDSLQVTEAIEQTRRRSRPT